MISRIRVNHEPQSRKALANCGDKFQILARLDLDFDALITRGQFFFNGGNQGLWIALNAHGNAASNLSRCAAKQRGQWNAAALRFDVPQSVFERGFSHFVTANWLQKGWQIVRPPYIFPNSQRSDKIVEDRPGSIGGFWIVERTFASRYFAPAGKAFGTNFHQQNAASPDFAKAGLKGRFETNMNFAKDKSFYFQKLPPTGRTRRHEHSTFGPATMVLSIFAPRERRRSAD